jgi:hypothetical protein
MPCIYCANPADSPEHWLPRSLGNFGEQQVLRDRVCRECNETLGRDVDLEWIRTGPEGIFRAGLGIVGRREEGGNPFYFRAATDHPVQAVNVVADGAQNEPALLWEAVPGPDGTLQGRLLEQIVVLDAAGQRRAIPYNVNWKAATLREALAHRGIHNAALVEVYLDEDHVGAARVVLSEVLPGFRAELFARDGAGQQQRRIQFANHLREPYFRGIVKIAFHGALKLLPHLSGAEREFDRTRQWARFGVRPAAPFWNLVRQPIVAELGNGVMLRDWGHLIAVEADYGRVLARMQFFVGPQALPRTWVVDLGPNPSLLPAS